MLNVIRGFLTVLALLCSPNLFGSPSENPTASGPNKKILVLIIASDNHPAFLTLQEIWKAYMHLDPEHIEAYFIKGDPNLKTPHAIVGDTLYSKTEDNYQPGILKKTVLSLEYFSDKLPNYDYVLRTNLSSFYVLPRLLEFTKSLPTKNCYAALPMFPSDNVPSEFHYVPFGWGAGFILSPDLAELLVRRKEELYRHSSNTPDDVLIGALLNGNFTPIIPTTCCTYLNRAEWFAKKNQIPENIFHFRAKAHYTYRQIQDVYTDEIFILSELLKQFYPTSNFAYVEPQSSHAALPAVVQLNTLYTYHATLPSDINEHLPLLRDLASECPSVTEIGMKPMVATWALLQGLAYNPSKTRSYVGIDTERPSAETLVQANKLASANGIQFQFIQGNELKIDLAPTDILFIDALHTYPHVTYELEKFSPHVKKYIVLHDTSEPWGTRNDTEYQGDYSEYPLEIDRTKKGVWAAVEDFLSKHPEWKLKEHRTNNHGIVVLER